MNWLQCHLLLSQLCKGLTRSYFPILISVLSKCLKTLCDWSFTKYMALAFCCLLTAYKTRGWIWINSIHLCPPVHAQKHSHVCFVLLLVTVADYISRAESESRQLAKKDPKKNKEVVSTKISSCLMHFLMLTPFLGPSSFSQKRIYNLNSKNPQWFCKCICDQFTRVFNDFFDLCLFWTRWRLLLSIAHSLSQPLLTAPTPISLKLPGRPLRSLPKCPTQATTAHSRWLTEFRSPNAKQERGFKYLNFFRLCTASDEAVIIKYLKPAIIYTTIHLLHFYNSSSCMSLPKTVKHTLHTCAL